MNGKVKGILTFLIISLSLTLLDIFIVETFYRPTANWDNIIEYHKNYWALIIGLPVAASILLNGLMPMATWVFFITGLEDTLFYGLQGYLPPIYWGVSIGGIWEPALETVLKLNVVGVIIILVYLGIIWRKSQ